MLKWLENGSLRMILANQSMLHCFLQNGVIEHKISATKVYVSLFLHDNLVKYVSFGSKMHDYVKDENPRIYELVMN